MTTIEQAETTVADLEIKRHGLIDKGRQLDAERQRVSFAAHTGDKAARVALDKINTQSTIHGSELASIEAAIVEAKQRLASARTAEAKAADRAAAEQLRKLNIRFRELGLIVDDAFADVISASNEMREVLDQMRALGITAPSHQQFI
jgi:hypothetical protein